MIKVFNVSALHERYANETDEEKTARYAANKKRITDMVEAWDKFAKEHPEAAKQMRCAA
jgi:hypothetical protein